MEIEEKELTPGQGHQMGRAKAVTELQFQMARDLAASEFGLTSSSGVPHETLLAIVQILATNYLATVQRSKG